MGNRAVIKAQGNDNKSVYLHWNGGRDSVEAFLKYCELRGFRAFEDDYGMARFVQVVSNFLGADGLSIGIHDGVESYGDNGIYTVKGWEIVGREDYYEEQYNYDLDEMLQEIDKAQPIKQQLGEDFFKAKTVKREDLIIGDTVLIQSHNGIFEKLVVVGFGEEGKTINGTDVSFKPYVNKYLNGGTYDKNINNYITDKVAIVLYK